MKKNIIIFGNGNHCKVVKQEIEKISSYRILAIFDFLGHRIILNKKYKKNQNKLSKKVLAITAVGDNKSRKKLVKLVEKKFKNIKWVKIISRDSIISKNVTIKEGTLIVSGAVVNTNSKIGSHCIINTLSSLDHDVKLGDYSDIAPGVNIAGNVTIGSNVFVGIGSSVIEEIKIENNVKIGGQSLVNKNCRSNKKYVGVPAKKVN
jgi:sugar O-acyltransferase (sialic acid O-acetyltransferase NeuD family)|tara:strand:- start:2404 stop:3018 length:615 start_codon:yes stop_codon:yes gene_type:complete